MSKNRLWVLGAVLLMVAVAALGWVLGIAPKLAEASAAQTERVSVETQNTAYAAQLSTLKKQFESIGDLRAQLADLRKAVPSGADIPVFVGQLDAIARTHRVTLTAIAVTDAQPYAPPVPAASTPAAASAAGSTATASAVPAAAPAATAATPVPVAPVGNGLVTAQNFVAVPFSLSVAGGYQDVLDFIEGLQKGTRLVMVTTFSTTPAAPMGVAKAGATANPVASGDITAKISALVYVLLDPAEAAATPAATVPAG